MANEKTVKQEKSNTPVAGGITPPRAKKSLGQNFLNDRAAAQRIVESLGDISQKTVIEIGPGRGVLTGTLIARAAYVIAIEIDRVLAAQMRMKCANIPNIEVIEADILDIDIASLLGPRPGRTVTGLTPRPPDKVRVVGNIPYYITSDILLRLFEYHQFFETIVIMVQKEVAERIVAKPGTSEYGLLSATCQLYARVENLFTLPPEAFSPSPKVHSSVVRLTIEPRWEKLHVEPQPFVNFLKLSFGQKRKTLVNNLKQSYDPKAVKAALEKAKARIDVRAEALTLEKAAAVFKLLAQAGD
jgi:16S rRNA (adenine1518-N6/adenine1519-N6)-dimethyltransferase